MLTKIRQMVKNRNGFLIIEMLPKLVLMVMVAFIIVGRIEEFSGLPDYKPTEVLSVISRIEILENAVEMYKADCGEYPATLEVLKAVKPAATAPVTATEKGPWLVNKPTMNTIDPWETPYQYDKESGYIYSLGEDKVKNEGTDSKKKVVGEGDYDAKTPVKKIRLPFFGGE